MAILPQHDVDDGGATFFVAFCLTYSFGAFVVALLFIFGGV